MVRTFRFRVLVAFVVLAFGIGLVPRAADASFEVKLNYWPTTVTNSRSSGQFGNWDTNFWGGDLRWTSTSNWGIHLKYDTGSEGSWGGSYISATGGTDRIWSADLFYAWTLSPATVRTFAGYGDMRFESDFGAAGPQVLEANGYRIGADAQIPVPNTGWAFNASVAWYPSTSTSFSFVGFSSTSSASATDYSASVQYMWPQGWLVEAGYRWVNTDFGALAGTVCPCTIRTSGPFFDVGFHW